MAKNRAFVRYNKKGIIAPGSLVITKTYPDRSQNLWYEVPTNLLGGTVLTSSLDRTSLPWTFSPGNAVELSMGCMSNTADWIQVYAPLIKDLITPADVVSHMNSKLSFLGTFEVGKDLGGDNTEIIFNLSPQLAEDLNKPGTGASSQFCGFGILLYLPV
jgi:hypothetical protein